AFFITRWKAGKNPAHVTGQIPFLFSLMALLAVGVTQVIAANELPSGLMPYQSLPARTLIYLVLGGLAAFSLTWLALVDEEWAAGGAALAGAGLYSSVIFFRVSAVPEVGYAWGVLAGFGILALLSLREVTVRLAPGEGAFWKWAATFGVAQVIAAALSPVPHQSINYVVYILVLICLAGLVSLKLRSQPALDRAVGLVVLLGAGLPVVFALIKSLDAVFDFGLAAAAVFRLHPSEMGGANLLARSLVVAAPFGLSLLFSTPAQGRWQGIRKIVLILLQIAILLVILYARSFEGFFAWLVVLGIFGLVAGWPAIRAAWSRISALLPARIALIGLAGLLVVGLVYGGIRLGYSVNPYSFNGRFGHWIGALTAFTQHPLFGGGPDNEYLYTRYAAGVSLFGDAPEFIDDPLYMIRYRSGILRVHAHNLILETAAFSGLAGVITGGGMLVALIWMGLKALQNAGPRLRILLAACLGGILGELAWGLLDVIRESPPFFSFPIWAVVGMTLAAARLSQPDGATGRENIHFKVGSKSSLGMIVLAVLVVLLPSMAANRYSSGFLAYQEHRWEAAAQNFHAAARLNPLSAQYYWMLSKSELELGEFDQAARHLDQAIGLKRGFSPYLSQAGWLAWLNGDLEAAERYFEDAIAGDPLEGWTSGLHASLGMLKVFQGQQSEAVGYLAQSFAYHPELAAGADWIRLQSPEASIEVSLAPAYAQANMSLDLQRRIYAHLGMADITPRHFEQPADLRA
ncbi:MAG TPA: hypothetical protein VN363_09840, partial [Anaerolineales bacterium]|nr:hypothetical protein [Anaerolineales bacterium]